MKDLFIYLPLIICGLGLLMYLLLDNPKGQETGRIMFWVGLLAFLIKG